MTENASRKGKRVVVEPVEPLKKTKHMDVNQAVGFHLPEDILMEILSRLPVRYLLRFKCVSKFWRTLISQPVFTRKHLNHAKNDEDSQKFLLSECCRMDGIYYCYCRSFKVKEEVRKLDFPSNPTPRHCVIHCCCDGLALIEVGDYFADKNPALLLWNPSTSESVVLPRPEFPSEENTTMGLGYDSACSDYKILKIHKNKKDGPSVLSEILALKCGSWRKIENHPSGICNVLSGMQSLAFTHGAFHWIGSSEIYSVVSFSISNEVYGEISLPSFLAADKEVDNIGVSEFKGMLCFYSTSLRVEEGMVKLWVMKEYGVKESWSQLFNTIDSAVIPKYMFVDTEVEFWFFLCGRDEGPFILSSRGPFELLLFRQWGELMNGVTFTESLISPKLLTEQLAFE